ncbi:MAG: UDP-3-O-acyl-N-acetylglucosamine deacetylase [Bacteroidales bacterium]|nr:UDP-3-O-acyl-N-acetylglucosamine deacetylase [Bacteroidales bacterium]MBQ9529729.1 UDP-3-O-acyl-N-acetylglucosamine deacetylase [Bacteroidales bacterium]
MQHTIKQSYKFCGKGLHTGVIANMTLHPAEAGSGIRFVRTDIGPDAIVPALATKVGPTNRSTTICSGEASVSTLEHLMSACAGLGIDNLLVEIDAPEVPILDGSAKPYVEAILADGLLAQDAPRKYLRLREPFHHEDESGAIIDILHAESLKIDLTVDFNSKVLGVQHFVYSPPPESSAPCRSFAPLLASAGREPFQASGYTDYATQIAPCRTFCFFHELEFLASKGLIKGGDTENAIVVVEHPVDPATLKRMQTLFGVGDLQVHEGYLNNLQLYFPDEIVRHKMLDILGDFALLGAPLLGTIIARKTGHRINTAVCKSLLESDLLY